MEKNLGSGISLKPIEVKDAWFINELSNNEDIIKILCEDPTTVDFWKEAISEWLKDEDEKDYIIVRISDNKYIGWIGINGLMEEDKSPWIKIISILPESCSKGYGKEAIKLIKANLYKQGYKSLQLWTDECNARAQGCYLKSGFIVEGKETITVGTKAILRNRLLMKCGNLEN